jgi:hypothetical protein
MTTNLRCLWLRCMEGRELNLEPVSEKAIPCVHKNCNQPGSETIGYDYSKNTAPIRILKSLWNVHPLTAPSRANHKGRCLDLCWRLTSVDAVPQNALDENVTFPDNTFGRNSSVIRMGLWLNTITWQFVHHVYI